MEQLFFKLNELNNNIIKNLSFNSIGVLIVNEF